MERQCAVYLKGHWCRIRKSQSSQLTAPPWILVPQGENTDHPQRRTPCSSCSVQVGRHHRSMNISSYKTSLHISIFLLLCDMSTCYVAQDIKEDERHNTDPPHNHYCKGYTDHPLRHCQGQATRELDLTNSDALYKIRLQSSVSADGALCVLWYHSLCWQCFMLVSLPTLSTTFTPSHCFGTNSTHLQKHCNER